MEILENCKEHQNSDTEYWIEADGDFCKECNTDMAECREAYNDGMLAVLPVAASLIAEIENWHGPVAWDVYLANAPELQVWRDFIAAIERGMQNQELEGGSNGKA